MILIELVGHWGTFQTNFIYTHLNRIIKRFNMIYISGQDMEAMD